MKKKKSNILGGSVKKSNDLQLMNMGGQKASQETEVQMLMSTIYNMFKQGMTEEDVEFQLISQNMPYNFVIKAIDVVKNYMQNNGEYVDEGEIALPENPQDPNYAGTSAPQGQQESEMQNLMAQQQMDAYRDQSMQEAIGTSEDEEEFDQMIGLQMGGESPESKDQGMKIPYYANIELVSPPDPMLYMKKGGSKKLTKKKFMQNILKRFEGGQQDESIELKAGPKKDTLENDVTKVTQGFKTAVQKSGVNALSKKMYKLAEQSDDPNIQKLIMSGAGSQQGGQPMDMPMANDGIINPNVRSGDKAIYPMSRFATALTNKPFRPTPSATIERPPFNPNRIDYFEGNTEAGGIDFLRNAAAYDKSVILNDKYKAARKAHEKMMMHEMEHISDREPFTKDVPYYRRNVKQDAKAEPWWLKDEVNSINIPRREIMNSGIETWPKQELGGIQYADDGAIVDPGGQTYQQYIDWYNEDAIDSEKESREAPMSEEEFNAAYGPAAEEDFEKGRTVYDYKYQYAPSDTFFGGIADMLIPANRIFNYRDKYAVDPRLGKPVARDVYGKTLLGGKKYIDYYEMPDEDFDPEILRRRDINRRARQGNRFLRKALKGKLDYKDILDVRRGGLDALNRDIDDMSPGDPQVIDTGRRRRDNRTFAQMYEPDDRQQRRYVRQLLNQDYYTQKEILDGALNKKLQDISNSVEDGVSMYSGDPNITLGSDMEGMQESAQRVVLDGNVTEEDVLRLKRLYPDKFINDDLLTGFEKENATSENRLRALQLMQNSAENTIMINNPYAGGTGGIYPTGQPQINPSVEYFADPRSQRGRFSYATGGALDKFVLGGFDPTMMYNVEGANRQERQKNMLDNAVLDSFSFDELSDINTKLLENDPVSQMEFNPPPPPSPDDIPDPNTDPEKDEKKKKKLIGIENREKLALESGQNLLLPVNMVSDRTAGSVENYRKMKPMLSKLTESKDEDQAQVWRDRGGFNIYGDYQLDRQGFEGSAQNRGMTDAYYAESEYTSKYGGPSKDSDIRYMTAAEIQKFMDEGGKLEFL